MVVMQDINEFAAAIVREFRVERIILFGSHAYGEPTKDSDVDLLVDMEFGGKGLQKSLEILNLIDPPFAVDVLVRRPEDTLRRYAENDPLIREALDRGKVLYERNG